jgi:hypothetical protein
MRDRLRWFSPWLSLGFGVGSALTMDRGPRRGAVVAACAVLVWFTLLLFAWLPRVLDQDQAGHRRWLLPALRRASLMATQSMLQLTLFFALPFYWQAATLDEPGHVLFIASMILLCAVTLWDPLTVRLLSRPLLGALLPATGSFVALCAVLPGLGFSTRTSLWLAAAAAGVGTVLVAAGVAPVDRRRAVTARALLAVGLLGGALALGAARAVPAAPLRLIKAEIGTRLAGKWLADPVSHLARTPERLICATAIWSPLGVHDQLFHVWRRDGALRARIELDIRGGRGQGYRTNSRLQHLGHSAEGVYRCTVESENGQVLGSASVRIGGR